jgi:hypothetical protein
MYICLCVRSGAPTVVDDGRRGGLSDVDGHTEHVCTDVGADAASPHGRGEEWRPGELLA